MIIQNSTEKIPQLVIIIAWEGGEGGGGGFLGGSREQKGGLVVTKNRKGGSLKTLEGFRGGTTQICLENEDTGWETVSDR